VVLDDNAIGRLVFTYSVDKTQMAKDVE